MINIKHLMDTPQPSDGQRLWVEPIGLTRDMIQWCNVQQILLHVAPPIQLWDWFEQHPEGYDYFRAKYHQFLDQSPHKPALRQLARRMLSQDLTFLHQGEDPMHNTATALYEFLSELSAYCPPEE